MFSLFKRQNRGSTEETFKTRVARFWRSYAEAAPRFLKTIDERRCADLTDEVVAMVDGLNGNFAWEFGPGANGIGHSFTLSGEADPHRQLLAAYWLSQAPSMPGWTFHASRQPSEIQDGSRFEIDGTNFDPLEFWLTPFVDTGKEMIDLTVWHPKFPELPDKARWTVLFLQLDEALGEIGTQNWIGEIEINDQKLADAIPLKELAAFVEKTKMEHDWKKGDLGDSWTLYELKAMDYSFPRSDIVIGTTCVMKLIDEYLEVEGDLEDPLKQTGADYVYVAFDAGILPRGQETAVRGKVEDALVAALSAKASGQHIGGGLGSSFAYIDLLLFDGSESLGIVKRVLQESNLPKGTLIDFFGKEKRGQRIVL